MTDILNSATPFPATPIVPDLPLPPIAPKPIKTSYTVPIIISSIVAIMVMVGVYFLFINKESANISEVSIPTTPTSELSNTNPGESPIIEESILQTITTLTKPMIWTEPVAGTLMDAQGNEIMGTLITSIVTEKEKNELAGLLVTDSVLPTQYGWKEDPSGMAAGMGETLSTYLKDSQKLIIRYKGGTYQVLLSK